MKKLLLPAVLLVSACSMAPPRTGAPPVVDASGPEVLQEPAESARIEAPTAQSAPNSGAVLALLDRAETYRRSGDSGNAAATIERALRIDPGNAGLWTRLAALRLEQEQPEQAVQLAMKSNALATGDHVLQAHNWRLIAAARRLLKDTAGAREAERKAAALQ